MKKDMKKKLINKLNRHEKKRVKDNGRKGGSRAVMGQGRGGKGK